MHPDKKCLGDTEIGAYIEGRLSPEKKEALERCLDGCPECRMELAAIRRMIIGESPQKDEVPERLMEKAVKMYPRSRGLRPARCVL